MPHPFAVFAKGWAGYPRSQNEILRRKNLRYRFFLADTERILVLMPTGLKRYYGTGALHFITCSCYQRRPLLDTPACRNLFLKILEEVRLAYDFTVYGYVVMPEHVHLLLGEPERGDLSRVMQVLKQRVARRVLSELRKRGNLVPDHFWLTRFHDFNVWSDAKRIEKLRYLHRNPVVRGLVADPEEWAWSSFRFFYYGEPGLVVVNAPGKLRIRTPAA